MARKKLPFSSDFIRESRRLSLEAMGAYVLLMLAAAHNPREEKDIIAEKNLALTYLHTQTNKWLKLRKELVENNFITPIENNQIRLLYLLDG